MFQQLESIPRRNFLTSIGKGIIVAAAGLPLHSSSYNTELNKNSAERVRRLSELFNYTRYPINPPNKHLIKPIINAAYSPYDPDPNNVKRVVKKTRQFGSDTIRVYMTNEFEPTTGNFNLGYLNVLKHFAENVERESEGQMGIIISLMDCYNLLYRDIVNGLYKAKPLNHHALIGLNDPADIVKRQQEVFTKQKYIDDYITREQLIVRELKPVNHLIRAWEIANEPDRADIVGSLNGWYSAVVPALRAEDPDTPIISGVKNPLSIDSAALLNYGLDHNSAHVYGPLEQQGVHDYVSKMTNGETVSPLLLSEYGTHRKLGNIMAPPILHDYLSARGLREIALENIIINPYTREAHFPVYGFGLWQLDYSSSRDSEAESRDGFGVDPDYYPNLAATMQELSSVFSFN